MRKATIILTVAVACVAALSVSSAARAQVNRCEALATEMERIPCYYARAGAYQHRYVYRHSFRRHALVTRHRKHSAARY